MISCKSHPAVEDGGTPLAAVTGFDANSVCHVLDDISQADIFLY
jgi:hypothetical protein